MMCSWKTLVILCLTLGNSVGLEKHWLPNVEWSNPSNWLDGSIPKIDSRVVFPLGARHAIGMPRIADLRIAGLELPWDGVVALPQNGKLVMSERGSVKGPVSRWLREIPFYWADPNNWNTTSEAVPHLERLPCQNDVVVLPESSRTFSVRLPLSREIEVRSVRLSDDNSSLARWEWRQLRGRTEFLGSGGFTVKYSPLMGCENCRCQEGDLSDYWEEICSIQRPRCGYPACEYPLKVEGHCCYYCGGRIKLSTKTLLSTIQRVSRKILNRYQNKLFWHSRLTWDGHSEILITERDSYESINTVLAVDEVKSALSEEGVEVLFTETSGDPLHGNRLAVALIPFLGGFVVLLLLVILVFPIFGYTYSQVWDACRELGSSLCIETRVKGTKRRSFGFARFENIFEGNVQIADEDEDDANAQSSGERFENPLYKYRKHSRSGKGQEKKLDLDEPVSLVGFDTQTELDRTEDIEMDIESL